MAEEKDILEKYLEMTGQSFNDLMTGASQYGMDFIVTELVPKAVEDRKKIVWEDTDVRLGLSTYSFENI